VQHDRWDRDRDDSVVSNAGAEECNDGGTVGRRGVHPPVSWRCVVMAPTTLIESVITKAMVAGTVARKPV
jgi:hypothetical protein